MSQQSSISLPKLESFDWRIDIKSSSNQIHHMNVPTVMVDLKVKDIPVSLDEPQETKNVVFEMSKEALDIMLEGLGQINEQLSNLQ